MSLKLISFDWGGPFAHFRVPTTTTSPNTYPFPPRTTVIGMLGNVLKMSSEIYPENDNPYYSLFDRVKIGVQLLNPIHEHTIGIRYQAVKNEDVGLTPTEHRAPIPIRVLVNPKYRIYVSSDKEILDQLVEAISNNPTPYMGLSEMVSSITNLKINNAKIEKRDDLTTKCVLPISAGIPKVDSGVVGIRVPISVNQKRVMAYDMVFYNKNGGEIEFKPKDKQVRVDEEWIPLY